MNEHKPGHLNRRADQKVALWEQAQHHKQSGQLKPAAALFRRLLAQAGGAEEKAQQHLALGQTAELACDFAGAIRHYKAALALEPAEPGIWYFILNNLGYSHNQLGQFAEGEHYCRLALKADETRHNAHKNLGLALEGQGRSREAGACFARATLIAPVDGRAYQHLLDLIRKRPELAAGLREELRACAKAREPLADL